MSKINAEWHKANPMPKKPTEDQRLEWHLAHLQHCHCRTDLPKSVLATMEKRGIPVPEIAALISITSALGYCDWNHARVLGRQPLAAVMLPPR